MARAPLEVDAGSCIAVDALDSLSDQRDEDCDGLIDEDADFYPSQCPAGTNIVEGSAGADDIAGSAGPDCILGYGGDDVLRGLDGNDVIAGGAGDDQLIGGDNIGDGSRFYAFGCRFVAG